MQSTYDKDCDAKLHLPVFLQQATLRSQFSERHVRRVSLGPLIQRDDYCRRRRGGAESSGDEGGGAEAEGDAADYASRWSALERADRYRKRAQDAGEEARLALIDIRVRVRVEMVEAPDSQSTGQMPSGRAGI